MRTTKLLLILVGLVVFPACMSLSGSTTNCEEDETGPGMKCVRACWDAGGFVRDYSPRDYTGTWAWKDCICDFSARRK